MLRAILRRAGFRVGLLGTAEYDLVGELANPHHTTPNASCLKKYLGVMRERKADYCVMELASESFSDDRLSRFHPDMVAITSIFPGYHMKEHGESFKLYRKAKAKAVRSVSNGGIVFANSDQPDVVQIAKANCGRNPIVWFGTGPDCHVQTGVVHADLYGTVVRIVAGRESALIQTRLVGRHQAHNIAAATAVSMSMGARMSDVIEAVEAMSPIPARLEPVADVNGIRVFVDYGHPEAAMDHTFLTLREVMGSEGRIIVVFGGMGERPADRRREYGRILSSHADEVYLTMDSPKGEDPRDISEQIRDGMTNPAKAQIVTDRQDGINLAVNAARPGDCVLVLGRGLELVQELDAGYASVESDYAMARAAARRRMNQETVA
jgi:UDP-N-acetylmuramyl-tripeptide synthetase